MECGCEWLWRVFERGYLAASASMGAPMSRAKIVNIATTTFPILLNNEQVEAV